MESKEQNRTAEVTEVKEKVTLKERVRSIDWKKIGRITLRIAKDAVLLTGGYLLGKKYSVNAPIPVEGTVEESEDDSPEA